MGFLSTAYLTVANLGLSLVPVFSQASLLVLDYTGGHITYPPIEGLSSPTGTEPTLFQNLASKVSGLQVHATTVSNIKKITHM